VKKGKRDHRCVEIYGLAGEIQVTGCRLAFAVFSTGSFDRILVSDMMSEIIFNEYLKNADFCSSGTTRYLSVF
jgi:hypothetical protein